MILTVQGKITMIIYFSLLVCVVGALAYALSSNPKIAELGRLAYACGLLALGISVFLLRR